MASLETNNDSLNKNLLIPNWIQEDYFREILEEDFPDFERIVKFTVKAATGPGENYSSVMIRVHINVAFKNSSIVETSYIVKTTFPRADTSLAVPSMIFTKEIEIYQTIIPRFQELYKEAGKIVDFGPRCKRSANLPERSLIVMEDLMQRKFKNVDRLDGLDLKHMEEALKKLAEFHAVSAVHNERFGPFAEHFTKTFLSEETRVRFEEHGTAKNKMFHEVLKEWGGCEKYIEMWPTYNETYRWFIEHEKVASNELAVLNHGDCWTNNIMFQYDKQGQIQQTFFIDFQMCKWGSPTRDLYYLITSSAAYEIKVTQFDRFIKIYHKHLAENLKLLKYQKAIPTLKDIHILMIKYSLWGFHTAVNIMALFLLDPSDKANLDSYMNDKEFQRNSLMNPRYVKTMKQLLPWWENRGVFDF